jgi:hypothetical protein
MQMFVSDRGSLHRGNSDLYHRDRRFAASPLLRGNMSAINESPQATIAGNTGTTKKAEAPISQEKKEFRKGWAEWAKQLPQINFPETPNEDFELIDRAELEKIIAEAKATPKAVAQLNNDLVFLDRELLRLFRQRDFEAKFQQNRYRYYQIAYMLLATGATVIGSFLAVSLNSAPDLVPWWGFLETIIAVLTTYLATISANEPALPSWLENRRKAEQMRREYYRFLMDLPPYDSVDDYDRRRKLSIRVANINRGLADANVDTPSIFAGAEAAASSTAEVPRASGTGVVTSTPSSTMPPSTPLPPVENLQGGAESAPIITSPGIASAEPANPETPLNPNDPTSAG